MPAILEQTTVEPMIMLPIVATGTPPSVDYDSLNQVTAKVIVSTSASGDLSFRSPTIALLGPGPGQSPWGVTVLWNLVTDNSAEIDSFEMSILGTLPLGVTHVPETPSQSSQFQQTFEFDETVPLFSFRYRISGFSGGQPFCHDPTIVVTPDPIDS